MRIRHIAILAFVLILSFAGTAMATKYPTKNISMLVGYSAGGGTDTMARIVATELEKVLGKRIQIVNRPGADGQIATAQMAAAKPDGYTIGMVTSVDFLLGPIVTQDVGYTMDDLIPIAAFQQSANALTVKKGSPFTTLEELVAYGKANPGKLSFSHSGTLHIALITMLEAATGAEFNVVRFAGGGDNLNAVMGGHVDGGVQDKRFLRQAAEAGVVPLAIASAKRFADMPELRTFAECGIDIIQPVRRVLVVPKATPAAVVKKLTDACLKIYDDAAFIDKLRKQFEDPDLIYGEALKKELDSQFTLNSELLIPRLERLKR